MILLIVLALTGSLLFVLKVVLGVALGIVLGVVLIAALVGWRIRRALRGPGRRWQRARPSSRIEVLDPGEPPPRSP